MVNPEALGLFPATREGHDSSGCFGIRGRWSVLKNQVKALVTGDPLSTRCKKETRYEAHAGPHHNGHRHRILPAASDERAGRPGAGTEVRARKVLWHREGSQERLPDGQFVLRGHVEAGQAG